MAKGKFAEWLKPESLLLLAGWARTGLTDEQIAHNMGITASTLYEWKKRFPEISEALKENKEIADTQVENALFQSALGHTVTVKKAIKLKRTRQKDGAKIEEEYIDYTEEEVYIPPSNTAQIFWLKNRQPERFRDHPIPQKTDDERPVIIDDFK